MAFTTAFNTLSSIAAGGSVAAIGASSNAQCRFSNIVLDSLFNPTTPAFWVVNLVGLMVLGLLFRWAFPRLLALRGITYVPKTMFGKALIFDSQDADGTPIRLLNVNNAFQSVSYIDKDLRFELACMYHRNFALLVKKYMRVMRGVQADATAEGNTADPNAKIAPTRCVVIGGGGYSFPKYLVAHHKSIQVFAIEIDPAITELAKKHFFLDDLIDRYDTERNGRLQLCCVDGWQWLRDSGEKFDLIVNDAFAGKRPLGPLGTLEGAKLIHEHLCEHGLYIANIISVLEGRRSEHLYEALATFEQVFAHVYMIAEYPEDPKRGGCNVMVASDADLSSQFGIQDLLSASL